MFGILGEEEVKLICWASILPWSISISLGNLTAWVNHRDRGVEHNGQLGRSNRLTIVFGLRPLRLVGVGEPLI